MRRTKWSWLGSGLALAAGLLAGGADATAASLTAEIGIQIAPQKTGSYGTVVVTEANGGFDFEIRLAGSLGKNADLHEFYFNLPDAFSKVQISDFGCDGGSCKSDFTLARGTSTSGGASSRFDYRVSFGNGAGAKGNGKLQEVTFHLDAKTALSLASSPFDPSFTSRDLAVIFALHVPGAKGVAATLGVTELAPIPEPGTGALLSFGVLALARLARRRRAAVAG